MFWWLSANGLSGGTYSLRVDATGLEEINPISGDDLRLLRSESQFEPTGPANFVLPGIHQGISGASARRTGISGTTHPFPWFAYVGQGNTAITTVPPLIPALGSFGPTTFYDQNPNTGFYAYTYDPDATPGVDDVDFEFKGWWSPVVVIRDIPVDDDQLTDLAEFYPATAPGTGTHYIQARAIDTQGNASGWSTPIEMTVLPQQEGRVLIN